VSAGNPAAVFVVTIRQRHASPPPTPYAQKRTQTTAAAYYIYTSFFFLFSLDIFRYLKNPKTNPSFHHHLASSVYQPTGEYSQRDRYVQGGLAELTGSNTRETGNHFFMPSFSVTAYHHLSPCPLPLNDRPPPQSMRSETHPTSGPPIPAVKSPETAPSLLSRSNTFARRARPDSTLSTGSSSPPKLTSSGSRLAM